MNPGSRSDRLTQRRLALLTLGAGLSAHAPLLCAQAAAARLRRVGVLVPGTREKEEAILKPFFEQMRELGWIEGQTIAYDRVFGDDLPDRLPALAAPPTTRWLAGWSRTRGDREAMSPESAT